MVLQLICIVVFISSSLKQAYSLWSRCYFKGLDTEIKLYGITPGHTECILGKKSNGPPASNFTN